MAAPVRAAIGLERCWHGGAGTMSDKRPCDCAWTQPGTRFPMYDARGIFLTYACDNCEVEKRLRYRPDVFTDPNYEADEPIDDAT